MIRVAEPGDVEAIVAFGVAVVPDHYTPLLGAEAAHGQLRWWTRELMGDAVAARQVRLAVTAERIVGVCETGAFESEPVVWKLYVAADERGHGVGVALLDAAVAALPPGTPRILLEHFAGNTRAATFYDRLGFEVLRVVPSDSGDAAAAVVWRARRLATEPTHGGQRGPG